MCTREGLKFTEKQNIPSHKFKSIEHEEKQQTLNQSKYNNEDLVLFFIDLTDDCSNDMSNSSSSVKH